MSGRQIQHLAAGSLMHRTPSGPASPATARRCSQQLAGCRRLHRLGSEGELEVNDDLRGDVQLFNTEQQHSRKTYITSLTICTHCAPARGPCPGPHRVLRELQRTHGTVLTCRAEGDFSTIALNQRYACTAWRRRHCATSPPTPALPVPSLAAPSDDITEWPSRTMERV